MEKTAEWKSFDVIAEAAKYILDWMAPNSTQVITLNAAIKAHNLGDKTAGATQRKRPAEQDASEQPDPKRAATEQSSETNPSVSATSVIGRPTEILAEPSKTAALSPGTTVLPKLETENTNNNAIANNTAPTTLPKASVLTAPTKLESTANTALDSSTISTEKSLERPKCLPIAPRPIGLSTKTKVKRTSNTKPRLTKEESLALRKEKFFDRKCALLAKFKKIHGECTHIPGYEAIDEFKGLDRFVSETKKQMKLYYEDETKSELTAGQIGKLGKLGFDKETIHNRRWIPKKASPAQLEQFDTMLEKLRQYQATNGHCNVPSEKACQADDKELSRWAARTRKQIKAFKKGEPSTLSEKQVKQVLDLGFQLKPMNDSQKRKLEEKNASFDELLEKLKAYKEQFNSLVVIQGVEEWTKLRTWTMWLRNEYTRMREGEETILTVDRIARLRAIGFEFRAQNSRKKFSVRAREWLDFKTTHGREPTSFDNKVLHDWANRIRRHAVLARQNRKSRSNLTLEQIDLLTGWGFNWDTEYNPDAPKPVMKKWEARFEELVRYRERNGDCLVPQLYPYLGEWVKKQRQHFKLFRKGKKSILTQERVEKLRNLGFVWQVRAARPRKPKNERESESEDSLNNDQDDLFYNGTRPPVAPWDKYR